MRLDVVIPAARRESAQALVTSLESGLRIPDMVTVVSNEVDHIDTMLPGRILRFSSDEYPYGIKDVALRRDIGIWRSDADAIVFLDDDEIAPADMLWHFERLLTEKPVVWGHHRFIDFREHSIEELLTLPPSAGKSRERIVPAHHSYQSGYAGCLGAHRQTLLDAGGFDLMFLGRHANEDQNLAFRMCGTQIWVDEPPFAWHPTERSGPAVSPPTNQCSGGGHVTEPMIVNDVVFVKCQRCPHWGFADRQDALFRNTVVVPYDDDLVSVTEEEF